MKATRYDHISDQELLAFFYSDANQEWIGILLQRYTLLLLGVCMKYLKDETEAKDCVQQIFLKVLTEIPKYKVEYFKSWLYMVAKNHCLMRLRDKGARAMKELNEHHATHLDNDRHEILETETTYDLLEASVEELSKEQRICVTQFYLQKRSYQQIAGQTGYNLMQVKSYIQNGKRNLKIILERKLQQSGQHRK
jgi:RNA polymerase sigma-70 factor (ECF subfamily)